MEAFDTTIYYDGDLLHFAGMKKQIDQRRPDRWTDSRTRTHLELQKVERSVNKGWELRTGHRRAGIAGTAISEAGTQITFADGRTPECSASLVIRRDLQ